MLTAMASEVTCANCGKQFLAMALPPRLRQPNYFCCRECATAYEANHPDDEVYNPMSILQENVQMSNLQEIQDRMDKACTQHGFGLSSNSVTAMERVGDIIDKLRNALEYSDDCLTSEQFRILALDVFSTQISSLDAY